MVRLEPVAGTTAVDHATSVAPENEAPRGRGYGSHGRSCPDRLSIPKLDCLDASLAKQSFKSLRPDSRPCGNLCAGLAPG